MALLQVSAAMIVTQASGLAQSIQVHDMEWLSRAGYSCHDANWTVAAFWWHASLPCSFNCHKSPHPLINLEVWHNEVLCSGWSSPSCEEHMLPDWQYLGYAQHAHTGMTCRVGFDFKLPSR